MGGRVAERFEGTFDGFCIGKQKFGSRSAAAIAQSGKWQIKSVQYAGGVVDNQPKEPRAGGGSPAVTGYVYSYEPLRRFSVALLRAELVGCPRKLPPAARGGGDGPLLLSDSCFSRIAVRERERRFRIPSRDHPKVTGLISIASLDGQFPAELQKDSGVLQSKTGGTRRNHPSTSADDGIGGSAHKRGRTMRCSSPRSLPSHWTVSRRGDRRAYAQWVQNRRCRWSMTASNEEACSSHT